MWCNFLWKVAMPHPFFVQFGNKYYLGASQGKNEFCLLLVSIGKIENKSKH